MTSSTTVLRCHSEGIRMKIKLPTSDSQIWCSASCFNYKLCPANQQGKLQSPATHAVITEPMVLERFFTHCSPGDFMDEQLPRRNFQPGGSSLTPPHRNCPSPFMVFVHFCWRLSSISISPRVGVLQTWPHQHKAEGEDHIPPATCKASWGARNVLRLFISKISNISLFLKQSRVLGIYIAANLY